MALAAHGGLEAMKSAETKPNEWELGEPCAGKPPARFDEGASYRGGLPPRGSLYSTPLCALALKCRSRIRHFECYCPLGSLLLVARYGEITAQLP